MQIFRFAGDPRCAIARAAATIQVKRILHPSVCFGWIAGDPARFCQFEWRNDSNRALPDASVSGGT
jgi:hypothetical protein